MDERLVYGNIFIGGYQVVGYPMWEPLPSDNPFGEGPYVKGDRCGKVLAINGEERPDAMGLYKCVIIKNMPNAFKRYEKLRERMGEVQQTFNDDFLPKLPKTCGSKVLKAESELMFARGLKALVRARVEYERVHDELCHYYSLYRVEALSGAELSVIDQSELVVRPLGRNVLGYKYIVPQIKKHEGKIDEFAQKYMPESFAVYTSLKKEMDESQDLMNALVKELHLMDMTRVDRGSWALFGKIRHLCDELNDIVSVAEKFHSSYRLSEMSADTITQEDHKLALSKQNYVALRA